MVATVGLWAIYGGVSAALAAERALHANSLVVGLVHDYIVDHEGAWPRSWEDLEGMASREVGMFEWPADKEEVWRYVSVDFTADPDVLATQSVREFTAIQPLGPCYSYDPEIESLLKTLRKQRREEENEKGATETGQPEGA
jgi:hypothetical protein